MGRVWSPQQHRRALVFMVALTVGFPGRVGVWGCGSEYVLVTQGEPPLSHTGCGLCPLGRGSGGGCASWCDFTAPSARPEVWSGFQEVVGKRLVTKGAEGFSGQCPHKPSHLGFLLLAENNDAVH